MPIKNLDLTQITTRRAAMKVLKDLGFNEPGFVMTRGTKLLEGYDLSVTLAPANFMVMDRQNTLSFIPMLTVIGNTAESARAMERNLYAALAECGLVPAGTTDLPPFGFAVGIAMLGVTRASKAA